MRVYHNFFYTRIRIQVSRSGSGSIRIRNTDIYPSVCRELLIFLTKRLRLMIFFPYRLLLLVFFQAAPAPRGLAAPTPALDYGLSLAKYFFPNKLLMSDFKGPKTCGSLRLQLPSPAYLYLCRHHLYIYIMYIIYYN